MQLSSLQNARDFFVFRRTAAAGIVAGAMVMSACADQRTTLPTAPALGASPAFSRAASGDTLSLDASGARRHIMETLAASNQHTNALASGRVLNGKITYHGGFVIAGTDYTGNVATPKVAVLYWGGPATGPIYNNGPMPNDCWNAANAPVEGTCTPAGPDGSLLGFFLTHLGGSSYFNINTTYYGDMAYLGGGTSNAYVTGYLQYSQYFADPNPVPASPTDAQMAAELNAAFLNGNLTWDPTGSTIYAIFTPSHINAGGGFGTQYCAYHGHFLVDSRIDSRGVNALYAVEPYNADTPNCTAQTVTPNGDLGADTEVNTTAHELEESVTDGEGFRSPAWYDASGNENGDKCAWVWGPYTTLPTGAAWNINVGGVNFLVQENWKRTGGCAQHL
jgi:hypothetical protein